MTDALRTLEKEEEKEQIEEEEKRKAGSLEEEEDPNEDLSAYQLDIETVEMMAAKFAPPQKVEPTPQEKRAKMFAFAEGGEARQFNKDDYMGPSLLDTKPDELSLDELRDVLETLALREEKHEKALKIVRDNINDFSYILLDRYRATDLAKLQEERERREEERTRPEACHRWPAHLAQPPVQHHEAAVPAMQRQPRGPCSSTALQKAQHSASQLRLGLGRLRYHAAA